MAIIYRPASLSDVRAIQTIASESFVTPWTEKDALNQLKKSETRLLLDGEVPVVFLSFERFREHAYIGTVAVAASYRGKGYGKAMLRHALKELQGFRLVELNVWENNFPARHLYESLGFKTIRNVDNLLRMRRRRAPYS